MQAAGHQEVARALRRGLGQDGGLHLGEALLVQRSPDAGHHLGAHAQLLLHGGAAQVQIAVLQAHQLVFVGLVVDVDRRGLALVQQHRVAHHDLDLAGLELAVDGALVAQAHLALHGEHVLAAQALGQSKQLRGAVVSVEHQLHQALAVAQPDEHQSAQVAGALHPAGEMHGLTGHFAGQQAAVMIALVGKHNRFLLYVNECCFYFVRRATIPSRAISSSVLFSMSRSLTTPFSSSSPASTMTFFTPSLLAYLNWAFMLRAA